MSEICQTDLKDKSIESSETKNEQDGLNCAQGETPDQKGPQIPILPQHVFIWAHQRHHRCQPLSSTST